MRLVERILLLASTWVLLASALLAQSPIGSIVAWHPDLPGAPALPAGWVECNGQVLNDPASPYDGQVVPDLNGERRFLRGADASGILQEDAFQGHWHRIFDDAEQLWPFSHVFGGGGTPIADDKPAVLTVLDPISDGVNGTPRTADETRPVNMSVVWVLKVRKSAVPVGAILAWQKDFPNMPPLPDGWLECDGQVVSDPASPFDGLTLPDLNGEARFLRGDATSGTLEADAFQGHRHGTWHNFEKVEPSTPNVLTTGGSPTVDDFPATLTIGDPIGDNEGHGWPRTADETRPRNMSVVWIIKTKSAHTPPGAIVAWHRDFPNTPAAPAAWLECDGRLLNDPGAIFHLRSLPDLNGTGRFLRGGSASGVFQEDAFQGHHHGISHDAEFIQGGGPLGNGGGPQLVNDVSAYGWATSPTDDGTNGAPRTASETRPDNMSVVWLAYVPSIPSEPFAGLVVAWHADFPNTPALPGGWAEMNGQTLDDPQSPFDGQTLADLNGEARFLRGGTSSGALEADAFQGHRHLVTSNAERVFPSNVFGAGGVPTGDDHPASITILDPTSDGSNGTPRTAQETRPVNMSVVWLLQTRAGALPIGTILAWDKSRPEVGPLPPGWLECNGQVVDDDASPYDGQVLPDLNGSGRFLRGGATSGVLEADAFQGHRHTVTHNTEFLGGGTGLTNGLTNAVGGVLATITVGDPYYLYPYGFPRTADETRPVNMSVVWILKTHESGIPVGAIAAWLKDLPSVPALDEDWVECSGQLLDGENNPFQGQNAPDLNLARRFLRGGADSGVLQNDAFQGHRHGISYDSQMVTPGGAIGGVGGVTQIANDIHGFVNVFDPTDDGTNGAPRVAAETRPVNMSVVWIERLPSLKLKGPRGLPGVPGTAGAVSRNGGGTNPVALSATDAEGPLLGQPWTLRVELEESSFSVLVVGLGGTGPGLATRRGELLVRPPLVLLSPARDGEHVLSVPADPRFVGASVAVQAVRVRGRGEELTNALEAAVRARD